MMRKIDLDYRKRKSWLGWTLLGIGIVVASAMTITYASLASEAEQWKTAAAKATRQAKVSTAVQRTSGDPVRLQQEIDQANDVVRRLSLPWNELFRAMEDSTIDTVALLSVQPDPQLRVVNMNGEAQAYADVLTYMLRLDASGALTKALLVSHEVKRDDPQHPVAFTVTARWNISP